MKNQSLATLMAFLILASCSGPNATEGGRRLLQNVCINKGATYNVTYFELPKKAVVGLAGPCGPLADDTIAVGSDGMFVMRDNCIPSEPKEPTANDCMLPFSHICYINDEGGALSSICITGDVSFDVDGNKAVANISYVRKDVKSGFACLSEYSVTLARI